MLEGKPLFPGKDRECFCNVKKLLLSEKLTVDADVNQFSIITELLGTPPDDVIQTIASENVSRLAPRRLSDECC
jgi:p38 MAP kinase